MYYRRKSTHSMVVSTMDATTDGLVEGDFCFTGSRRLGIMHPGSDIDVMVWLPHQGAIVTVEAPLFKEVNPKGPSAFGSWAGLTGVTPAGVVWNYQFYSTQTDFLRVNADYKAAAGEYSPKELSQLRRTFGNDKPAWYAYLGIRSALQAHAGIGVEQARLMPYACLRAERGLKSSDSDVRAEAYRAYCARVFYFNFNLLYSRAGEA